MRTRTNVLLAAIFSIAPHTPAFSEQAAQAPTQTVEVQAVTFAMGISSRAPVGASDSFESSVRRLYFWSKLRVPSPPARIKHVWYHGDKKLDEYPIDVNFKNTRLWTYRRVEPGHWRVEVADDAGEVLTVAACIVRSTAAPSGSPPAATP